MIFANSALIMSLVERMPDCRPNWKATAIAVVE
jgi:hypothetical protein